MSTVTTAAPRTFSSPTTRSVNGLSLGVSEIFNAAEQRDYLSRRFAKWNVIGPPGHEPQLRELPPVHSVSALHLAPHARVTEDDIDRIRACAASILNQYFPPVDGETTIEDTLTFTKEPYDRYAAGTPVVIRKTDKATLFFLDPSMHVEADGAAVSDIRAATPILRATRFGAAPIDEVKMVTKILGMFMSLLPGGGTAGKIGMDLITTILGMAGSNGPNWSEITNMMRQVVREELKSEDFEHIQGRYAAIKEWGDVTYLPVRNIESKERLADMLDPYIKGVLEDIQLLVRNEYCVPGYALLLLGVNIYLGLLQERNALGYPVNLTVAGQDWANRLVKGSPTGTEKDGGVWEKVRKARRSQIKVGRYEYSVACAMDVVTTHYWSWKDEHTGQSRGDRYGPWGEGSKDDTSERDCRADADAYFENVVVRDMIATFGDPQATAKAWAAIRP